MNESTLTTGLRKSLKAAMPESLTIKHADAFQSGIMDLSHSWLRTTTWLEVKFANPRIIQRGVQKLMCQRMEQAGSCYYVIYDAVVSSTYIVCPKDLDRYRDKFVLSSPGFNHAKVAEFVRGLHVSRSRALNACAALESP